MSTGNGTKPSVIEAWKSSRAGAWAGRGFHYQHMLSTLILFRQWAGHAPSGFLVPEGLEDCVIELPDYNIWFQIKSRAEGTFNENEVRKILAGVDTKAIKVDEKNRTQTAVILEQPCMGVNEEGINRIFEEDSGNIFVCKSPGDDCVRLLSSKLNTAEVIAEGIVSDLYRFVAEASEENASLPFELRRRISVTEVETPHL